MPTISFKLKNAKTLDTIDLPDGKPFTILDLKFRIAQTKRLGGLDFDFKIRNSSGKEQKKESDPVVPGETYVAVRINAKGKGLRARLKANGMPTSLPTAKTKPAIVAKAVSPATIHSLAKPPTSKASTPATTTNNSPQAASPPKPAPVVQQNEEDKDEDEIIADILLSEHVAPRVGPRIAGGATGPGAPKPWTGGGPPASSSFSNDKPKRPLPPGYRCNRCHKQGHLIEDCPTKDTQEVYVRVKSGRGIPLQHLEPIDDIEAVDPNEKRTVVKQNNLYYFLREELSSLARKVKGLDSVEGVPKDLICVIDHKLAVEAIQFGCCDATASYSNAVKAVKKVNANGEKFKCPACGERCTPHDLYPAEDIRRRIAELLRRRRRGEDVETAPSAKPSDSASHKQAAVVTVDTSDQASNGSKIASPAQKSIRDAYASGGATFFGQQGSASPIAPTSGSNGSGSPPQYRPHHDSGVPAAGQRFVSGPHATQHPPPRWFHNPPPFMTPAVSSCFVLDSFLFLQYIMIITCRFLH